MDIWTIGASGHTRADFFGRLFNAGIRQVLDVRAWNDKPRGAFFPPKYLSLAISELAGLHYEHETTLAPPDELFADYRSKRLSWRQFEARFIELLRERRVAEFFPVERFAVPTALLGSRKRADRCHRRILAEFFRSEWEDVNPVHL